MMNVAEIWQWFIELSFLPAILALIVIGVISYLWMKRQRAEGRVFRSTHFQQVTGHYTKAIEQLGSDKIGAIYELERISEISTTTHEAVEAVLTSYVHENASRIESNELPEPKKPSEEVATVMAILAKKKWRGYLKKRGRSTVDAVVDLSNINLARLGLDGGDFYNYNFANADLRYTSLYYAKLTRANLREAHLDHADLRGADLQEADLTDASLRYANLSGALLKGTLLENADLTGAVLWNVKMTAASLKEANLTGTDLAGGDFARARFFGAQLIRTILRFPKKKNARDEDNTFKGAIMPMPDIVEVVDE